MTMWGFSSRKEQDGSTASTEMSGRGDPKLSPSKKSRRRIGRKRGGDKDNSNSATPGTVEKAAPPKSGPLGFSTKSNGAKLGQPKPPPDNDQEALRTSHRVMNQKQEPTQFHYDQQEQDVDVETTDGQGIEILLDLQSSQSNTNSKSANSNPNNSSTMGNTNAYNQNNLPQPKSPSKTQVHHSRRSMSNHHKQGRRSAPPDPKRPDQIPGLPTSMAGPVISLEQDILPKRTKIYRAQFSVFFPVPRGGASDPLANGPSRHRIPLGGRRNTTTNLSYHEMVHMLQHAVPVDEVTSVRIELKKTKQEMDALEEDKESLEQRWSTLNKQQSAVGNNTNREMIKVDGVDWDIHRLLNSKRKMSSQERNDLEQVRGRCITVVLQNPRSEDSFLAKCCGIKQAELKKSRSKGSAITMDPDNCRQGGAGATIRHLALLPRGSSFFVSRDNGKSYSWGQLPPRLLQRMKSQGLDPVTFCGDLMYLSTGPNGYYFAEFRSGECWWGCAGEDKEFYEILQQWDIYRVVFGSTTVHTAVDEKNRTREVITNSWIILGRDGRAAWKNLPSRLHHTLERRLANSAAPAEVALGSGDSFYVRFLDGTVDYCLPAELASVCERIQGRGGAITDMALHPEVSHEFMVRHTAR